MRGSTSANTCGPRRSSCLADAPFRTSFTRSIASRVVSSVDARRRKTRPSRMHLSICDREISPASYDAFTPAMPDGPAIRGRSRSKNAADRAIGPPRLARDFEHDRVALTSTGADGCDSQAAASAPKLVDESPDDPGARRADRVAKRDRAAVHVHVVLGDAQHVEGVEGDGRERLVDFPKINLVRRLTDLLQRELRRLRGRLRQIGEVVG